MNWMISYHAEIRSKVILALFGWAVALGYTTALYHAFKKWDEEDYWE